MNAQKFSRSLFWDINENEIEPVLLKNKDWVVPRVFEYGTIDEILEVIDLYGDQTVKGILLSDTRLKAVTKAMGRLFLDLDLK